jgi:hypothetical protein
MTFATTILRKLKFLSGIPCAEFFSNCSRNLKSEGTLKDDTNGLFSRKMHLLDNVLRRTPITDFMGIQIAVHLLVRVHGPKIGHTDGWTDGQTKDRK